jgi:hypothetical protein
MLAGSMLAGVPAIIPAAQAAASHAAKPVVARNNDDEHKENEKDRRPDAINDNDSDDGVIATSPGVSGSAIISETPAVNGWAPARPAAGMSSIVFLNSFGSGAPLTIDLQEGAYATDNNGSVDTNQFIISSEHLYTVPEATNSGMGHLQLALAPGAYNYTASIPNVGTVNGSFQVTTGQVMGLSFYGGDAKTIVHNHNQKDDNAQHTTTSVVFTKLLVAPQNLTAQAR